MTVKPWRYVATIALALTLGIGLGVAGTIGFTALWEDLNDSPFGGTEPGATRWYCDGAEVIAVATLDEGNVNIHLLLTDGQRRAWRLEEPLGHPEAVLKPRGDGSYPVVRFSSGDRDGGSARRVSLRLADAEERCTGTVSLLEASSDASR